MSESQTVPLKISDKFKILKEDLVKVVGACQERTFAEEINEIEKFISSSHLTLAEIPIEMALATDLVKGIPDTEEDYENRKFAYGDNLKPHIVTKGKL